MAEEKNEQVEVEKLRKRRATQRKKIEPVETATEVGVDPALSVRPGDNVYLTFLASQDVKIGNKTLNWLDREGQVPEDIDGKELIKLDRLVRLNVLTVGELPKEAKPESRRPYLEKDPSVLDYCKGMLSDAMSARELCSGLTRASTHLSGWAPKELLEALLEHESKTRSRQNIVNLINTALHQGVLISFRSVPFDPELHATSIVEPNIDTKIRTRP